MERYLWSLSPSVVITFIISYTVILLAILSVGVIIIWHYLDNKSKKEKEKVSPSVCEEEIKVLRAELAKIRSEQQRKEKVLQLTREFSTLARENDNPSTLEMAEQLFDLYKRINEYEK